MNVIFVASMAFDAYFDSSALSQSARKWLVQRHHQLGAAWIFGADHHPIGLHEVVHSGTLFEKFRVADDAEGMRGLAADDPAHFFRRPDRDRALVDDDSVAVHGAADIARNRHHVLQIGGPVLALRRADGDENNL
jgi:hypothetical protein